jgi:NAD(P)-dependent dehydrogenase (short-subunit alcohol dehydrogenase family)
VSFASLEGKKALVTGASRGIGRAIASELAAAGATVVVGYRSGKDEAEALAAEIGGRAVQADVSSAEEAARLVGEAGETGLPIAPTPQLDGHERHAELGRDPLVGDPLGRPKDDPGAGHGALLARRRADDRPERRPVGFSNSQRRRRMVGHGEHRSCAQTNLLANSARKH